MLLLPAIGFSGIPQNVKEASYLNYIQNKGQWDQKILFRSDFWGGNIFLEKTAFTYLFYPEEGIHQHPWERKKDKSALLNFHALRMEFDGAMENHQVTSENAQASYNNYFIGRDPKKWAAKVQMYKTVIHKNIYQGIDVKVFSRGNNVRYDFILAAGANPKDIRLIFTGQDRLYLRNGDLVLATSVGEIIQDQPYAYQQLKDGSTKNISCHYELAGNRLSISVGIYDKTLPLIIDPSIRFATYTGSTSDNWGMSASFDQLGNGYTAGICFGTGYPVTLGAFQTSFSGPNSGLGCDISLTKFDSAGKTLLFSTYLGGDSIESPQSITVDNNNCLVVLGRTYSPNFPMVAGCYNTTKNGRSDIIITKFNPTGTALIGSTFMGGSGDDGINITDIESSRSSLKHNYTDDARGSVHVDQYNNIYVTSCTESTNFPVTPGCYQSANAGWQDGCVFKMNPSLTSLIFSTYIGGSDNDAAYNLVIDSQDQLYVTGGTQSSNFPTTPGVLHTTYAGNIDGFITHFSFSGSAVLQSSYIGTSSYDQSYFVQTDKNDNVYLFGQCSGNYPITANVYANSNSGQFIHELSPDLSTTIFSTEFGSGRGTSDIVPSAFLVDNCQNIYVSGWGGPLFGYNVPSSSTTGMPVTPNANQSTTDGSDFYFATFKKNAVSIQFATFFGGGTSLEHVDGGTSCFDKTGVIYQAICAGCGMNQDMPVTPNVWSNTNKSNNCNNALVKYKMDLINTVAQANLNLFLQTGCAPFAANFINFSSNAVSYLWDFGDGFTSTATVPSHTYTSVGTYSVMLVATDLTTCNQRDTARLNITVTPPGALVPPMLPLSVCKGDSIRLNGSFLSANTYSWVPPTALTNPGIGNPKAWPLSSTIYSLTLYDSVCNSLSTRTVMVKVTQNNTKIICSNPNTCNYYDTLRLYTNANYTSYAWNNGQSGPFIKGFLSGLYTLHTIDSSGCKGFDSLHIYSSLLISPSSVAICEGQNTQLYAPPGDYVYRWYPASYLSATTIYNPVANPKSTSIYTLVVVSGSCATVSNHTVVVNPLPDLNINLKSVTLIPGESVQLKAKADSTCNWYPDYMLSCTACDSPVASPEETTIYYCYVENIFGCANTSSVTVEVLPTFYVPNSFSPNGDGTNDIFRPLFSGYTQLSVTIFNRWGDQIYFYNTLDGGWDGSYRGQQCEIGEYVYRIAAVDLRHRKLEKTGSVLLLR